MSQQGELLAEQKLTSTISTLKLDNRPINELLNRITDNLNYHLGRLYTMAGYKYVMDRFPAYKDDQLPDDIITDMIRNDSFACVNQDGMFFSTKLFLDKMLRFYYDPQWQKRLTELDKDRYPTFSDASTYQLLYFGLDRIIQDTLQHEYGHIINGHTFMNVPTDDEMKKMATMYTNEIEANRCVNSLTMSDYFKVTTISDMNPPFDCARGCQTREGIYRAVLEMLKNNQNNGGSMGNNSKQSGNSKQSNQNNSQSMPTPHNDVFHNKDVNTSDNKKKAMETLCDEIGIKPTKEMVDRDFNKDTVLEACDEIRKTKEIQKCISHIKGYIKGDLCRDKINTYSRQPRKEAQDGMLLKGTKNDKNKRPNILVALDSSGSMSSTAIKQASQAIKLVIDTIGRNSSNISICTFNTKIIKQGKVKDWEQIVASYGARGGTSFATVFEKAIDEKADVVLCVGDGQDGICKNYLRDEYKELSKYPKWVDVIIEPLETMDYVTKNYTRDEREGVIDRESLWIGSNADRINKALGNI